MRILRAVEMVGGGLSCLVVIATLLACGGSVKHMTAADGREAIKIKCKTERANCLEEASAACGAAGYHVLDEESHSGGLAADLLPGPVPWWTMMVRCGQPAVGYVEPPKAAPSVTPLPTVVAAPASPSHAQTSGGCSSDFDCSFGQKCVKDSYAYQGVCGQPVNPSGVPQITPPSGSSIGPGTGNCQFDTQCAIGFRCVKTSGGLYGNCMK